MGGTDERTDERKSPCVLQDIGPLGPLPKKEKEKEKEKEEEEDAEEEHEQEKKTLKEKKRKELEKEFKEENARQRGGPSREEIYGWSGGILD